MKVVLICPAQSDWKWEHSYTSEAFDEACRKELLADLVQPVPEPRRDASAWRVYIDSSKRSRQTAEALFSGVEPVEMQEIGEVPLCSFCDTKKQWPAWLWRLAGWLQWMTGSDRQPEKRSHTVARAKEVVKKLEKEEKDCILVVHPVFLRTMLGVLRRQGYCITASRMFGAMPLDRFRAAKWSEHCGGCQHNCLLTNPNCQIGREKALKRKANRG